MRLLNVFRQRGIGKVPTGIKQTSLRLTARSAYFYFVLNSRPQMKGPNTKFVCAEFEKGLTFSAAKGEFEKQSFFLKKITCGKQKWPQLFYRACGQKSCAPDIACCAARN